MWQRFTERARRTVFYAQEEAQKFGNGYVSTEHLLLGLIREADNIACRVLDRLGVNLANLRSDLEKHLPEGDTLPSQDMTLTPRAKRVIDLAYDEARNLNNNYIGTEHVLLGLLREGDGVAARVMTNLDISLEAARQEVIAIQDNEVRPSAAPPPPRESRRHAYSFNPAPYFHIRQGRYVPEHLFLMLVADPESDSAQVARAGLDHVKGMQLEVEGFMLSLAVEDDEAAGPMVLQRILDRAAEEARHLGHSRVLLRHLLLALAHESDSFIHKPILERLEELRQAAKDLPE